jgi:molybdenum cofactor synthesis domain-containing protein
MEQATKPITAALVIIGNEILSGKVEEANARFLAQELFGMGWHLREIAVVPDDRERIVQTVRRLAANFDHVFTSGGVGPTHDDITLDAVAEAMNKELVVSPVLELLLKKFYGVELLNPSQQRLAMVPEGATLHYGQSSQYPQMMVDNVYPLPGIPELFRRKFLELKELWPTAAPRWRRCLNLVAMETDLAELLGTVAAQHPNVQLGSYPTCKAGTWHLELVLESSDRDQLELALAVLVEALGVEPAPH